MFTEKAAKASKYRGVYKCGKKWKSQIQIDGVQYYIGVFDTQEEAANEYNAAAAAAKNGRKPVAIANNSEPLKEIKVKELPDLKSGNVDEGAIRTYITNEVVHILHLKLQLGRISRELYIRQIELSKVAKNSLNTDTSISQQEMNFLLNEQAKISQELSMYSGDQIPTFDLT